MRGDSPTAHPGCGCYGRVPVADLTAVEGLSAEQLSAIASFVDGGVVASPRATGRGLGARARKHNHGIIEFSQGVLLPWSALMWTRDNVDFGFNWSSVTWTSAFQQAG